MTLRIIFSYAAVFVIGASLVVAQQDQPGAVAETDHRSPMGWQIKPVPQLLRLHLPMLGPHDGVLIQSVAPGSAAEKAGLLRGDLLIEAGGQRLVTGQPVPDMDPTLPLVVIRRGRPQVLIDPTVPGKLFGNAAPRRGVATARSFGAAGLGGGQALSISQVGEHITLQYDSPLCPEGPIRFSGTAPQIDQQLRQSDLPESVQQDIRDQLALPTTKEL